jgi:hypothetical protein
MWSLSVRQPATGLRIFGNAENEAGEIGDVALAAFDELVWTAPTSARGLRALLSSKP